MMRKIVGLIVLGGMLLFLNAESRSEDTIKYDGPNNSGFGRPGGGTFYGAVRFHPAQSCTLKSIIFYQHQPFTMTDAWVYVHEEGQPTTPGQKIDSMPYPYSPGNWVRVDFATPHFRAGGVDFWIIVKITHTAGQLPLGVDAGPSVSPPHSFISPDGNIWQTLPAYGQNRNFNIRAIVRYIQPMRDIGIDEILINPFAPPNIIMTPIARVKNYGLTAVNMFPVTCSILGAGGVVRYVNTVTGASLASGDTARVSFSPFTPTISEPMTIIMRTGLINDDVPANDREVLIIPVIYPQDFEIYNGSYFQNPATGAWEWGVPTSGPTSAYSGTKCWGTVLNGNYLNNANWTLTSYLFYATRNNPVLKFRHWYNMENNLDGGNVKISTYPCTTWQLIKPIWGYNGTASSSNAGIPVESCYTGIDTTWTEEVFILPVDSGQYFLVRWHFGSDSAVTFPGWYIDDVTGAGFTGPYLDIGLTIILPGPTYPVNTPMTPRVQIRNFGGSFVTNFPVVCSIVGANGTLRYTNTQTVSSLNPGSSIYVNFSPWTPTIVELCTVKVRALNARATATTLIITSTLIEGFNDPTFPPPGWQSVIVQGTYNWERTDFWEPGPYEGTGYLVYQSFTAPAGTMARLITPPITSPTPLQYTLKFCMIHDPGYPGPPASPYGPDSLKVEYSTDGINFYRVTAFRRYEPYHNWTEHTVYLGPFNDTFYIGFLAFSEYGNNMYIDYVRLMPSGIVEGKINNIPLITMLNPPRPNPITNGITHLSFTVAEQSQVSLKIFDASGRLVKILVDEFKSSGVYTVSWDGRDDANRKLAEGIYFYMLETPTQKYCRKMVLIQN